MTEQARYSLGSDTDERFRRCSIMSPFPLLANAPSIQKLSLKHLPTVDSKRFMRVLDNTVTRVLLVSSFPRIISNLPEFSLLLGRNATVLFESYGPLSKAYDEQCAAAKFRPRYTNREAIDQQCGNFLNFDESFCLNSEGQNSPNRSRNQISSRLFEVTRLLLRELLLNPLAITALIRHREQWAIEPSCSCRKLAVQLVHLRSLTRNDLLTTPKARAKRDDFLERLRRRDLEQKRTIEELTNQLSTLQETQRVQLVERMKRMQEIQQKIKAIQEKTQEGLRQLKLQYDAERRLARQKHSESMRSLEGMLSSAKQQLKALTESNSERERKIRAEKWKVEDSISAELNKADTEMFEMQAEYDANYEEDLKEKEACESLQEKVEPLKERADAVMEEKRLEAERQAAEIEEQENMIKAATTIQSLWRSWKARKMIRAERRKRKKAKR
ncbi:unnamed protein product [Calicophoron daubneyi]|uniref:Dynein regulatory complex protein 10 n=1 Tax=Calicophoron daubneyi TaxID=300641 RepID=A0AAV2TYZ1_CALDB